jgi:hypothetical protein
MTDRWAGHEAHRGKMRNAYKILVGILGGKRPHRRPKCMWQDNIRMEVECDNVNWIHLTQDRDQWLL